MKWFSVVVALLLVLPVARAEGPDDQYVRIYNLIQEADKLNGSEQPREALPKYREAQTMLEHFQKGYPDWNPKVISYRLNYVAGKIAGLPASVTAPTTPAPGVPGATAIPGTNAAPAQPTAPSDWAAQLGDLNNQVRQLQADKATLEAKLKEALAVQPAALDPRELARAQDKIKSLMKENDLLKVTLDQQKTNTLSATDMKALEETRQALAEAKSKLAEQTATANTLALEKTALQTKLNNLAPSADTGAVTALRTENQLLKKQLADLKTAPASASKLEEPSRQLAQVQAQVAALQSDKEMLQLEKIALENRLKQSSSPSASPSLSPAQAESADATRLKQVQRERDELQKLLAAANKELYSRKGKAAAARLADLDNQLTTLRARLEVYEARQVPLYRGRTGPVQGARNQTGPA